MSCPLSPAMMRAWSPNDVGALCASPHPPTCVAVHRQVDEFSASQGGAAAPLAPPAMTAQVSAQVLRTFKAYAGLRAVCMPKGGYSACMCGGGSALRRGVLASGATSYPKRLATPAVLDASVLSPSTLLCLAVSLSTEHAMSSSILRQSPDFVLFVYVHVAL